MNAYVTEQCPDLKWERPCLADYAYVVQERPTGQALAARKMLHDYRQAEAAWERDQKALLESYVFENSLRVESFLKDHRGIVGLLLESAPHIKQHFGSDVAVKLVVGLEEDGSRTLQALAVWPGALRDAKAALGALDRDWWLENGQRGSGNIILDYELV